MGEYLTIAEIAEQLKVSERTVRNWVDEGKLKAYRFGNAYRVKTEDFEEFITQSQVEKKGE